MATREELADEEIRARKIRHFVDLAASFIMQAGMTRPEAEQLVCTVREAVLKLFPDGEHTYELIYAPRFRRLIDEFARPDSRRLRVIVPLRPRPQ